MFCYYTISIIYIYIYIYIYRKYISCIYIYTRRYIVKCEYIETILVYINHIYYVDNNELFYLFLFYTY